MCLFYRYSVTFPLYLDNDQVLYRQLGLGQKCLVLNTGFASSYGRMRLLGLKIPPIYPGDDILLMGGDYIFSKDGKLVCGYPTETNERPSITELLDVMKK